MSETTKLPQVAFQVTKEFQAKLQHAVGVLADCRGERISMRQFLTEAVEAKIEKTMEDCAHVGIDAMAAIIELQAKVEALTGQLETYKAKDNRTSTELTKAFRSLATVSG